MYSRITCASLRNIGAYRVAWLFPVRARYNPPSYRGVYAACDGVEESFVFSFVALDSV